MGKIESARECFDRAVECDPDWLEPLVRLGNMEYVEGEYKRAIKAFKEYMKRGGNDPDVLFVMARAAFDGNDCRTVLSLTKKLLKEDDELYELWELRGICQARLEQYNAACTSLNIAIGLNPEALTSLNFVGDFCYENENYESATEFYELSLDVRPDQPQVVFRYGTSLWFTGNWMEALEYLKMYTKIEPNDAKGWNNLGVVYREKGDVTLALDCYKRALKIDPSLDVVRKNLETAKHMQAIP